MEETKPEKKLFTKGDRLLIAALLVALALSALLLVRPKGGDKIRVYLGQEVYTEASLSKDQIILIEQPDGKWNKLVIQGGEAWMDSASCANQDCVHQGHLRKTEADNRVLGSWIVCLPNQVSVELITEAE